MHARYSLPVAVLVALAASASAFAQGTAAPRPISPEPRWYHAAIGGAVSRPPTAPVFGVEVADVSAGMPRRTPPSGPPRT